MAMMGYSVLPKALGLKPHHLITRIFVGGGGVTPLKKCCWCILLSLLTRLNSTGLGLKKFSTNVFT